MSDRIAAEEGALGRGAAAVAGAHGDILASLGRVQAELDALAGAWQGTAATSYAQMLTTWNADARRLNQTLVALEQALKATAQDQAALEEEHTSVIGGLGKLMGS